jgi:prepilin-type N-terminal cleavage/methylation domain-containing protein
MKMKRNFMNWNRRGTKFGHKSGGFALPEVLCAIVILSLSILASFSAMSYALTLTNEARNRMNDFSAAMKAGVTFNIWAEDYGIRFKNDFNNNNEDYKDFGIQDPPDLEEVDVAPTRVFFDSFVVSREDASGIHWDDESILLDGGGDWLWDDEDFADGRWSSIWLDITKFETKIDPAKKHLMKSPSFIIFHTTETANDRENMGHDSEGPGAGSGTISSLPREWQTLGAPLPYFG